jgi:hypothetical protein
MSGEMRCNLKRSISPITMSMLPMMIRQPSQSLPASDRISTTLANSIALELGNPTDPRRTSIAEDRWDAIEVVLPRRGIRQRFVRAERRARLVLAKDVVQIECVR